MVDIFPWNAIILVIFLLAFLEYRGFNFIINLPIISSYICVWRKGVGGTLHQVTKLDLLRPLPPKAWFPLLISRPSSSQVSPPPLVTKFKSVCVLQYVDLDIYRVSRFPVAQCGPLCVCVCVFLCRDLSFCLYDDPDATNQRRSKETLGLWRNKKSEIYTSTRKFYKLK